MADQPTPSRPGSLVRTVLGAAAIGALVAIALTALLVNIFERKQEAKNPFYRVVSIDNTIDDPAVWGKDFPQQYDLYMRTVDQAATKYGGWQAVSRTPTPTDPRTIVSQSRLDADPRLKTIFAGYAFAKDFRAKRGHAYMLEDQTYTERQIVVKQPGTCMNCHASLYTVYNKLGNGDPVKGFDAMNHMPYSEARKLVKHAVACIDCHDPDTMQLRVTRPAFVEGIRAVKALQGIADYDVNKMATRQEMRAYVCGQCHVEYYFKGPEKRLTFPWVKGLNVDQMMTYYDEVKFSDWTHAATGAGVLKAQHPEFEMWNMGIHARSAVSCADCHMPYTRVGGLKISDHNVRSPLLNLNRACQSCHRWPEEELKARVEIIQDRFVALRSRATDALVALIADIKTARAAGATDQMLAEARTFQREAQFRLDFISAENSNGFHAPEEAERIAGEVIDLARLGQLSLRPPLQPATTRPGK